jgi:protein TonB
MVGLGAVIAFHALVIWGLWSGLAQKAVEVIKKPISATIVEEIKKPPPPPPPPPKKIVEPPKEKPVVQPYVPPPDIPPPPQPQVEAPVIQSTPTPPPEPYVIAPPPPPVVVAPPAPPKPAVQQAAVACPNQEKPTIPREAFRRNIERGEVIAMLTIDEQGNVTSVDITSSNPPGVFDRAVKDTLGGWKCVGQGEKVKARATIVYNIKQE